MNTRPPDANLPLNGMPAASASGEHSSSHSAAEALSGLHAFSQFLIHQSDPDRIIQEALRQACALTGADGAGVRFPNPDTGAYTDLRCLTGTSLDPFVQTTAMEPALLSTAMVSDIGQVKGILETWFCRPHRFSDLELQVLELLARQTAGALERLAVERMLASSRLDMQALAEQMHRAEQNKDRFINTLSHELRNPLTSIMMSLSLLDRSAPGGSQAVRACDILKRQTAHITNLVDDLLDVTRISNNKIRLKPVTLELNAVAARVADEWREQFLQRGVDLQVTLAAEPVYIYADSTRIVQVLTNLLQNAAKFVRQDGAAALAVDVETDEAGAAWAVIRVRDDGNGIKPENLRSLFEPFSQPEAETESNRSGLGLGLTIVKGMVDLHGGQVSVFSAGENCGAEFTVKLPLLSGQVDPPAVEAPAEPQERPLRILVIEDVHDLADTACSLLSILGHEAEAAFNGRSGVEKAIAFKPDIILCDIGLPDMDGYDVARLIRSNHETEHIILIALSGYAQQEDIDHAAQAGFDQHVAKPITVDVIQKILRTDKDHPAHPCA